MPIEREMFEPVGEVHAGSYASGRPWVEVEWFRQPPAGTKLYTHPKTCATSVVIPPRQMKRGVDELYWAGWNACRDAMLKSMKDKP